MGQVRISDDGRGCIALTLDNPGKFNALDNEMIGSLIEELERLADDPACRVLLLRGANGDFCAGRDVGNLGDIRARMPLAIRSEYQRLRQLNERLYYFPRPTVTAIEHYALGAGTALATWSDIAIAADDAIFGYPEVKIGIPPTQTTLSLIRGVPRKYALEFVFTGRKVSAEEAARVGLITRAVPKGQFEAEAQSVVDALLANSAEAIALCKSLVHATEDIDYRSGMSYATELIALGIHGEDAAEGLQAFQEKRKPDWPSSRK